MPAWPQKEPQGSQGSHHFLKKDQVGNLVWRLKRHTTHICPLALKKKPPHRKYTPETIDNYKCSLSAFVLPERFLRSLSFEGALASSPLRRSTPHKFAHLPCQKKNRTEIEYFSPSALIFFQMVLRKLFPLERRFLF